MEENQLAATVVFCISFIGTVANTIIATKSQTLPTMRNSFGLLMTSQSIGDAVFCAIFAFFYSPMVFFNNDVLKGVSNHFSMVQIMCYDNCLYCHLFVALNRMCAICLPWKYERYFSRSNTKWLIIFSWVISITRCLISYGYSKFYPLHCDLLYDERIWAYSFTLTELRQAGVFSMDSRRKKEINFLRQAVLQGIILAMELFSYFHLASHFENPWAVFACTTVAWILVHCTDAWVHTIWFHPN
ncbi:unnamed protein product [Strongylus vulgaris]|uniref:G-protein coupled receptors family 1 profile domain-containing protein n=1 Tax=Strongylus vulgaris TaxID=40348 RepID=A0A3P7IEP9_STRVU|nr:unnamed protein product [Strongylus vulgaris]